MFLRPYDRQRVSSMLFLLVLSGCGSMPNVPAPSATKKPSSAMLQKSSEPVSSAAALPAAGSGRGGYYQDDGPGDDIPENLQAIPDADPRIEPYGTRGNKPYTVFGKRYTPVVDDQPFTQRGVGSWYGKKFHGQKTSSGELYDMYKMTAAHPTLPLPSYARVTNVGNGKQVIVRVNDRGPFHSKRVIDLSYTAALRLGYIGKGSTELHVERLLPAEIEQILAAKNNGTSSQSATAAVKVPTLGAIDMPTADVSTLDPLAIKIAAIDTLAASPAYSPAVAPVADAALYASGFYLQFGAYGQMANAETMRARLLQDMGSALPQLKVEPSNNLYRLYSGPFSTREEAMSAASQVQQTGVSRPFVVQR